MAFQGEGNGGWRGGGGRRNYAKLDLTNSKKGIYY